MWTESFTCNICGKPRPNDATDWWIGWVDEVRPSDHESSKPKFQLLPWSELMARSIESVHLCGLNCALKETERWLISTGNTIKRASASRS
jgi:hypothetical protein